MINRVKEIIRKKRFIRLWKEANYNNSVYPVNIFDIDKVKIGAFTYGQIKVLMWGHENESLKIGKYCSIAPVATFILGGNHYFNNLSNYSFETFYEKRHIPGYSNGPININDGVWIGHDVTILSGISIGKGAILAAKSVITKDVPEYAIWGGNPATHIKYRFPEEIRDRLSKIDYYDLIDERFYQENKNLINVPLSLELIKKLEILQKDKTNNI